MNEQAINVRLQLKHLLIPLVSTLIFRQRSGVLSEILNDFQHVIVNIDRFASVDDHSRIVRQIIQCCTNTAFVKEGDFF